MTFINTVEGYALEYKESAKKDIKKLETVVARAIEKKLEMLVKGAQNLDIKKLKGFDNAYRLRHGDYRVIYEVYKKQVIVFVVEVGHRKAIYHKYQD